MTRRPFSLDPWQKLAHEQALAGERSKTALVLAGGGLAGAVYEIGALRAIDELLVNRNVNEFDIVVGTSAGALVGSLLAKGITPGELMQALGSDPRAPASILPNHLFEMNTREFVQRGVRLPTTIKNALLHYMRHRGDMNIVDFLWSLIEALPSGLYDNAALERFVREVLRNRGLNDTFGELNSELFVIATDIDTGKRVVFGREPWRDMPLSQAVAASSAVPLLYRPVRIGDSEFVDGAVRGNASLDIAIEAGAKLIVCINPFVPIDNSAKRDIPLLGPDGHFISEKGAQAVFSQFLRITMQSSLSYHVKQLRRHHPDVDIIVIEPRSDDFQMAFYNPMRYSARVTLAQHGFESVTMDLTSQYNRIKATLNRHGIEITRRFVLEELEAMRNSGWDTEVVREMLERSDRRRQFYLSPASSSHPVDALRMALGDLERAIDSLEQSVKATA